MSAPGGLDAGCLQIPGHMGVPGSHRQMSASAWSSGVYGGAWCRREVARRSLPGTLTRTSIDAGMAARGMPVQETRP